MLHIGDVVAMRRQPDFDHVMRFTPQRSCAEALLAEGDVLLMARGAHNSACMLTATPPNAVAAAYFLIVRPTDPRLLPRYLAWYLNQAPVQEYFRRQRGQGAHMPVLRRVAVEALPVSVPPLDVQTLIVELDELLQAEARLTEELLAQRQRLCEALAQRAAGFSHFADIHQ